MGEGVQLSRAAGGGPALATSRQSGKRGYKSPHSKFEGRTSLFLLLRLDLRPHLVVKAGFGSEILEKLEFGHDVRRRIDGGILEVLGIDERFCSLVGSGELREIGNPRADLRIEEEVDELLSEVAMRRLGGNDKVVLPDLASFLRDDEVGILVIVHAAGRFAADNESGCVGLAVDLAFRAHG